MTPFEDRLRAGLERAARVRPATDEDRALLQVKLRALAYGAPDSARGAVAPGGEVRSSWSRRWRAPMLAAAAVAVVAVTAITAATLGSDGGGSAATPGVGTQAPPDGGRTVDGLVFAHQPAQTAGDAALLEGAVTGTSGCLVITSADRVMTVPVFPVPGTDPASLLVGDRVSLSGGYTDSGHLPADVSVPDQCRQATDAPEGFFLVWTMTILHRAVATSGTQPTPGEVPVDPTTEVPPAPIGPVTVGVDTGWSGTAAQHLAVTLQTGSLLQVTSTDSDAELPRAAAPSDGTPLGYLAMVASRAEKPGTTNSGGSYLYGVVGPAVERIAITATDTTNSAQDVSSADLLWVIAGTGATGGAGNRGARIIWTTLADGWRGFAVQATSPSPALTVLAWNSDRQLLQMRRYTPGGQTQDLPLDNAPDLPVWDPEPPAPSFGPDGPNGADGPFVATYPDVPDQPAHDALLQGTLGVQNGCVVLRTDGDAVTLLFPQSQIQPATAPAILTFRGHQYHDGDKLSVAGSEMTRTTDLNLGNCPTRAWAVSAYH